MSLDFTNKMRGIYDWLQVIKATMVQGKIIDNGEGRTYFMGDIFAFHLHELILFLLT